MIILLLPSYTYIHIFRPLRLPSTVLLAFDDFTFFSLLSSVTLDSLVDPLSLSRRPLIYQQIPAL